MDHLLQLRGPETAPQVHAFPAWENWYDGKKIKFLRAIVHKYSSDPRMREFAIRILQEYRVEARDYPAMAAALLKWVQTNIYYVEERGEQLFSPWRTIQMGAGDCDDSAILLATLAESINLKCRFVISGKKGKRAVRWVEGTKGPPDADYSHIYCEFQWPEQRPTFAASAEPTMPGAPLGYDFVLHGAEVSEHGKPGIGWAQLHAAQEKGMRRIGNKGSGAQGFSGPGADSTGINTTTIVRGMTTSGVLARIWEETLVVIPVTIAAVLVTHYIEKWLKSRG